MANNQLNITDVTTVRVNVQQQPNFWTAFFLIGIIAILWHFKWLILGAIVITAIVYTLRRRWLQQDAEVEAILRRADQQNNWVYAGDPRGFYGDSYEGQVKRSTPLRGPT